MREMDKQSGHESVEELEQANEDLQLILDSSLDDILVTSGDGIVLSVSQSFANSYRIPPDDLVGKSVLELEKNQIFQPSVTRKVMETKTRHVLLQTTMDEKKMLVTGVPVFGEDGELRRIVSYSHDVTELLQLRAHLADMQEEMSRVRWELEKLRGRDREMCDLLIASDSIKQLTESISRIAKHDVPVLLLGESGVGKSAFAKFVHRQSDRNSGPFIQVNCGAIPEHLIESELFGYEPGAFTGAAKSGKVGLIELAHDGTLFLDEIGELPLALQVKFLKVLEDKQFRKVGGTKSVHSNFRLVCATNRDMSQMVLEGEFRKDLYYRLNTVEMVIPPLRERPADIMELARHFLHQMCLRHGLDREFGQGVMHHFLSYHWPGNIRELEHVVERAVVLSSGQLIELADLPLSIQSAGNMSTPAVEQLSLPDMLAAYEKRILQDARQKCSTTTQMAAYLGVSQPTIVRKLQKYFST